MIKYVGYFTNTGTYPLDFKVLAESMNALGLTYDYIEIADTGSWLSNCARKSGIMLDFVRKYQGQKIVYIDVDAIVITPPTVYFESLKCDIAAHMFADSVLASGVIFFNCNKATEALCERWVELCRLYPKVLPDGREAWDQRVLQMAIKELNTNFAPLMPQYNWITGLSQRRYPNVAPVILSTRGALKNIPGST